MNSHTMETVERCAKEAGAIVPCSLCGGYDVYAEDEEADRMTYARATNTWKAGNSGFRGMVREQVVAVVKQFLESADDFCPACRIP